MENELENQLPEDQQPPGDVTPVSENGNINPAPPAEITTTSALPVRIPTKQLIQLDNECTARGIARSELVREIFAKYYASKGKPSDSDLQRIIEQLTEQNKDLQHRLDTQELAESAKNALKNQGIDAEIIPNSRYSTELEVDLLNAVNIACKSIMPTRTDFRKRLRHYGRLEADRT